MLQNVPKKRIILISAGVGSLLIILFLVVLFLPNKPQSRSSSLSNPTPVIQTQASIPTPKLPPVQTSFLSFQQKTGTSSAVILDTGDKAVTAVQLEIAFDPSVIQNVTIQPGNFFNRAFALLNRVDYKSGSIFYVLAIPPNGNAKKGKGEVATIYYTFNSGAFNPTTFQFLPRTKIAAVGIDDSVLKSATPITVASE